MGVRLISLLTVILMTSGCAEKVDYRELVLNNGKWYKKFSGQPYTGQVTGQVVGVLKDGWWADGRVIAFDENGSIQSEGYYENGKREGLWRIKTVTGPVVMWSERPFVNGKLHGVDRTFVKKPNGELELMIEQCMSHGELLDMSNCM